MEGREKEARVFLSICSLGGISDGGCVSSVTPAPAFAGQPLNLGKAMPSLFVPVAHLVTGLLPSNLCCLSPPLGLSALPSPVQTTHFKYSEWVLSSWLVSCNYTFKAWVSWGMSYSLHLLNPWGSRVHHTQMFQKSAAACPSHARYMTVTATHVAHIAIAATFWILSDGTISKW